jgi:alkaline phosphatase
MYPYDQIRVWNLLWSENSLGLFSWNQMKFDYERESQDPAHQEPSLPEMVKAAIEAGTLAICW